MEYKQEFCVDGLDGWGKYEGNQTVNQVVLLCRNDDDVESKIKFVDGKKKAKVDFVEYLYMATYLILAILLLFGSLMFWQIRNKLNFKGNLIQGHLNLLTGLYLCTFVALVVYYSEYARNGSNAVTVVSSDYKEGKRIGWFCTLIGIVSHYVYLSVYFWIGAMMYYDLSGCLENMRKRRSIMVGLGAPLVLMIAFGIVDLVYR